MSSVYWVIDIMSKVLLDSGHPMTKEHEPGQASGDTPPTPEPLRPPEGSYHDIVTQIISGPFLEWWAAQPSLERTRVRLMIEALTMAFDDVDRRLLTYPVRWAPLLDPPLPYPTAQELGTLLSLESAISWHQDLPPSHLVPDEKAISRAASDLERTRSELAQSCQRISRTGGPNPDFA